MFNVDINSLILQLQKNIFWNIEKFILDKWPDIFWAIIILFVWLFSAIIVFKFVMYLFKRFKILDLIDRLDIDFWSDEEDEQKKI